MIEVVFCASAAGAVFLLHVLVNRLILPGPKQASPQRVTMFVCAGTTLLYGAAGSIWHGMGFGFYALATAGCICYCYFHLFNMSETARRIRILVACYRGELVDQSLYAPDAMITTRLDRLVALGSLRLEQDRYYAKVGPLLFAARLLDLWGKLLFGNREK